MNYVYPLYEGRAYCHGLDGLRVYVCVCVVYQPCATLCPSIATSREIVIESSFSWTYHQKIAVVVPRFTFPPLEFLSFETAHPEGEPLDE